MPLGLIAVGLVALVLLAMGGFGVLKERAALREQIRDLRAQLAQAVQPEQLSRERSTHRELEERNEDLGRHVEALTLENHRLVDTVAGLELQLDAQRSAAEAAENTAPASSAKAASGSTRTVAATTSDSAGKWFVNFGSYASKRTAERWVERLQPEAGRVVVLDAPGGKLFRVRVVALPDRATAQSVATSLQSRYNLSRLWVGED
ncbi:MAG: SPOR domain-containing protein [Parahaliea sp.]